MDDIKKTWREGEESTKEGFRNADGEDLSDKIGNLGDDIRKNLGNAGDEMNESAENMDDPERRY